MRIVVDMQGAQTESRKRGIGRYTRGFTEALLRNSSGHDIHLILNGLLQDGAIEVFSHFSGLIPASQIKVWNGPEHSQLPAAQIVPERQEAEKQYEESILSLNPDVVILTTMLAEVVDPNFTCALDRLSGNTLIAAIVYDFLPYEHPELYLADPAQKELYEEKLKKLKKVDVFLCISKSTAKLTSKIFPESIVRYIGTDTDSFFKETYYSHDESTHYLNKFGIRNKFFFYSGGSDRRKNIAALVEAYTQLPSDIQEKWQLVLAIDKEIAEQQDRKLKILLEQAQLSENLHNKIVCTGRISDEELRFFYSSCELFIFPSLEEGFGLTVLEAMRCGAPAIVADGTSLPEVMTWPEARFDPQSPSSISFLMHQAVTDANFMSKLKIAATRCQANFSWDETASRTFNALVDSVVCDSIQHETKAVNLDKSEVSSNLLSPYVKQQLFVDITNIVNYDFGTGVQRVVRGVLENLLHDSPSNWVVRPVYFDFQSGKFKHAHGYLWLNWWWDDGLSNDSIILFNSGDLLLRLDLNCQDPDKSQSNMLDLMHKSGVLIYTVVYDLIPATHPHFCETPKEMFTSWLEGLVRYDGAICISQFVATELQNWIVSKKLVPNDNFKISWFHLGSDIAAGLTSKGLPNDAEFIIQKLQSAPTFLVVSTLEPRKSHQLIFDAFEDLWKSGSNVNLVFVGRQGWSLDLFCKKINSHPENGKHFFWLSHVSDEYLDHIYKIAHAVIMASEVEGFGLAIVEAARHKTHLILRDIPVFHEIAGGNAIYFGNTSEELAETILNTINSPADEMLPDSSKINFLSWKQSTEMLLSRLPLENNVPPRPITIMISTWPCAFDCPGGGEVQLLRYEEYLSNKGVKVRRYDPWNPQLAGVDIFHYFSVMAGTWCVPHYMKRNKEIPLVVSPIIWLDKPENYCCEDIQKILVCADRILPNSHAESQLLLNEFDLDSRKIVSIVNGVDEIFFEHVDPSIFKKQYSINNPFVLCVANIEPRKNQLGLIRALKDSGLDLVLAGRVRDPEYAARCNQEADASVHFIGELEHGSEMQRSAYAAAEVFALPSILETPGLAALEAAAAGCRLVVTSGGCTEEYFGGFATYCDPYSPHSIRNAIDATLKSRTANNLLQHHIKENYTWERAANQLLSVYIDLIEEFKGKILFHNSTGKERKNGTVLFIEKKSEMNQDHINLEPFFGNKFKIEQLSVNADGLIEDNDDSPAILTQYYDYIFIHNTLLLPNEIESVRHHKCIFFQDDDALMQISDFQILPWINSIFMVTSQRLNDFFVKRGLKPIQIPEEMALSLNTGTNITSSIVDEFQKIIRMKPFVNAEYWDKVKAKLDWKSILPSTYLQSNACFEAKGWYSVETHGIWSGQKSTFKMDLEPKKQFLVLDIAPFMINSAMKANFYVDGLLSKSLTLNSDTKVCLPISEDLAKQTSVEVTIEFPDRLPSMKELGVGDDIRALGLFLSKIATYDPLLHDDEASDFGESTKCMNISGWWTPESSGRWAITQNSSFSLLSSSGNKKLELTVLTLAPKRIKLIVNESILFDDYIKGQKNISVDIPAKLADCGLLDVTFLFDDRIQTPKELGLGEDDRPLGIYVSQIKLASF